MIQEQAPSLQDSNRLYERYVRPLEPEHRGRYATVTLTGDVIVAQTLLEALQEAEDRFGQEPTVTFKIGAKVVGKIR
jgi:hypothetical protein